MTIISYDVAIAELAKLTSSGNYTKNDLFDLASRVSVDTAAGKVQGSTTLLYSGEIKGVGSGDIINDMMRQGADIRVLDKTQAGAFLTSSKFKDALGELTVGMNADDLDDFYKELYHPTTGPWAKVSERFAAETVGEIRFLGPNADFGRQFGQTELPQLLAANSKVTHIEGIPIDELRRLSLSEAFDAIVIKSEFGVGTSGFNITPVDVVGSDGKVVIGSDGKPKKTVGSMVLGDFLKPEILNAEVYVKAHPDAMQRYYDFWKDGGLTEEQKAKLKIVVRGVSKGLTALAVVAGLLSFNIATSEAAKAAEAGDTDKARRIMEDWSIEAAGGSAGGVIGSAVVTIAAGAAAMLGLAVSTPVVVVATIAAGIIGGIYGSQAAQDAWAEFRDNASQDELNLLQRLTTQLALSDYHTVFGTAQGETLTGSEVRDYIHGGGGDDTLNGLGGNDELLGGAGNDTLYGGDGADKLDGGDDVDTLYGEGGNDTLIAGSGHDILIGGTGNDDLQGGFGNDTYRFTVGDGVDVINDEDGKGIIEIDGRQITGGKKLGGSTWVSEDRQFYFSRVYNGEGGYDLIIARRGLDDRIRIKNWVNGQFGIILDDASAGGDDALFQVIGDQKPYVDKDGFYQYENYYNVVTTGEAEPGFADVLFGSQDNDKLWGGDGNDALSGYGGNDLIEGGTGHDLLSGGAGRDHILGGSGRDYIFGGGTYNGTRVRSPKEKPYEPPDNAEIIGATWAIYPEEVELDGKLTTIIVIDAVGGDDRSDEGDVIDAGAGDDYVDGGYGDDVIDGGDDNDELRGGAGNDVIDGGSGNDVILGDNTRFSMHIGRVTAEEHGNDLLFGGTGNDTLIGQGGSDELYGDEGDDKLWGDSDDLKDTPPEYAGSDYLNGGSGNDLLVGGAAKDILYGGTGHDELWGDDDAENLSGEYHADDYLDGGDGDDELIGGGGSDVLLGGDGADKLFGDQQSDKLEAQYQGDDYIDAGAGDDYAEGGGGNDVIYGGSGDDTLWGDTQNDTLDAENHGHDVLDGGEGNDTLMGNGGNDILKGGFGNDKLFGDSGMDDDVIDGAYQGEDILDGGVGDDYLEGGGGNDTLYGGDGDDEIHGDASIARTSGEFHGDDFILAGTGKDRVWGDGGNDSIHGGDGDDFLHGDASDLDGQYHGDDTLIGGDGNDTLVGGGGSDYLSGEAGNDTLYGDDKDLDSQHHGDDILDGGSGDDVLIGGGGSDTLYGGSGNDVLRGGSLDGGADGNDLLDGGEGSDALQGDGGDDWLYGGEGDDTLSGGEGDDLLDGGSGRNVLRGGAGNDTYIINAGDSVIQDTEGDNILVWWDAGVNLKTLVQEGYGGLSVTLVDFGMGSDGSNGSYGFQGSTHEAVSVEFKPMQGEYLRLESEGAVVWIEGGLDSDFGMISDGAGNTLSWDVLLQQAAAAGGRNAYRSDTTQRWLGSSGSDVLESSSAGFSFVGGRGDDEIIAAGGGNTFYYSQGDGTDSIRVEGAPAEGQPNTLVFGYGIRATDIRLGIGQGSLLIRVGNDWWDQIHIQGFNALDVFAPLSIERFQFADGTVLSYRELLQRGFDLEGGWGNDTLNGTSINDRISGGGGDDVLVGGAGDDTYFYALGEGQDQILELDETAGNLDTLRLGDGILPDEVQVTHSYRDVKLHFADGGSIVLKGQLDGNGRGIEQIEFADGTRWSAAKLLAGSEFVIPDPVFVWGTDGDDVLLDGDGDDEIYGGYGNDLIIGSYGDDVLYGNQSYPVEDWYEGMSDDDEIHGGAGNDILHGGFSASSDFIYGGYGTDRDMLYGGSGDDTYRFEFVRDDSGEGFRVGPGDDTVIESGDIGNADRVVLSGLLRREARIVRAGNDLRLEADSTFGFAHSITVRDFFADATAEVEFFEFEDITLTAAEIRAALLQGGAGDDFILGYSSDDVLAGNEGNDTLDGGEGADTYLFTVGDGQDVITDSGSSGEDVIRFGSEVNPTDIAVVRSEHDLLLIIRSTQERIILRDWFGSTGPGIEVVEFANGVRWLGADLSTMAKLQALATEGRDFISGTSGNDVIHALGGDDEIYGLAGDDTLIGGTGNDILVGGAGNDVYRYASGDGHDVIADQGADDLDVLEFGAGVLSSMVQVRRDGNHLRLEILDAVGSNNISGSITLYNWFVDADNRLAEVRFSDGAAWSAAELEARAGIAGSGDDFIEGTAGGDLLYGLEGNDTLRGLGGDDTLAGNQGNDLLDGGDGDDLYLFELGNGDDRIVDASGQDTLRFGVGIRPEDIQVFVEKSGEIVLQRYGSNDRVHIPGTLVYWNNYQTLVRPHIERIEFADGTVWSGEQLAAYAVRKPTAGEDWLSGSDRGEIFDGLGGGDLIEGGLGDDRYIFRRGYGELRIRDLDATEGNADTLVFGEGILSTDLIAQRESEDLVLELRGTSDRIRIDSFFRQGSDWWNLPGTIEYFEFADGTRWSVSDLEMVLQVPEGTDGNESIYGSARDDVILGRGGNDWLEGGAGNDDLDGGYCQVIAWYRNLS